MNISKWKQLSELSELIDGFPANSQESKKNPWPGYFLAPVDLVSSVVIDHTILSIWMLKSEALRISLKNLFTGEVYLYSLESRGLIKYHIYENRFVNNITLPIADLGLPPRLETFFLRI